MNTYVSWRQDGGLFENGVVILMYHKIRSTPLSTNWAELYVRPRHFARQMDGLLAAGVPPVPIDGITRAIAADERGFCVTFDDGFCNVFEHALPILRERKLRAIQFVVADRIGGEDAWDRTIGEPVMRLMDDAQIRDWLAAGQDIGSHTLTHPLLTTLSHEQARAEIFDSKKRLEDRFGIAIRHFCYPYGDHDEVVCDLVAEAGYVTASTTKFGANRRGVDPFGLRRMIALNTRSPLGDVARKFPLPTQPR